MKTLKGPAIFLAQFLGDEAPFNTIDNISQWAAGLGYTGVQIPSWDPRAIDLAQVAASKDFADEYKGKLREKGLEITDLASHLQGQLVAVHPAYNEMFDAFAPDEVKGKPKARTEWAIEQMHLCAQASKNLGLTTHASFTGALLWHTMYPWPQRPAGLVETGFAELAKRWTPILDAFDQAGCDVCYEIHPGEDVHDGITFEMFLAACNNHSRCKMLYDPSHYVLQQLDYLEFIDIYHDYIKIFHVKDAEFRPNGRVGVYGGYQDWNNRAGRFRSLGDGQVDFKQIFSKLAQYDYDGWAVLEWECSLKHPEQGATEGAPFIADHIITVTDKAFDDFAGNDADEASNRRILGLD